MVILRITYVVQDDHEFVLNILQYFKPVLVLCSKITYAKCYIKQVELTHWIPSNLKPDPCMDDWEVGGRDVA